MKTSALVIALAATAAFGAPELDAQRAEWELPGLQKIGELEPYDFRCGPVQHWTAGVSLLAEHEVHFKDASYLRLHFDDARLAPGSWIEVRSDKDGESEYLSAEILARHRGYSAFFNGDSVRVRFYAAGNAMRQGFRIDEVAVGLARQPAQPLTLCGADNRVPSQDKRVARMIINGAYCKCTAFLISAGNCFATAGHCFGNFTILSMAVEFNVPPSDAQGNCQHPPVSDQYKWMGSEKVIWKETGLGNDWAVFKTEKNSITNKYPGQIQGDYFRFGATPPQNATLRITGHGIDSTPDSTRNRTQQTSTGPFFEQEGNALRYRVDTKTGNSGSPVIDENSNRVIGIHTNGGCAGNNGHNKGTWIFNPDFLDACDTLCSPPDWGNFDKIALPPSGCRGSGAIHDAFIVAGHHTGAVAADLATVPARGGTILLQTKVERRVRLRKLEVLERTATSSARTVRLALHLPDASGRPSATPVRSGTARVSSTAAWIGANIAPINVAAGTTLFVAIEAAPGLVLPRLSEGSPATHWQLDATGMRGPYRSTPWAFRVYGSEPRSEGIPNLRTHGVPTRGQSFDVLLSQGAPNSLAVLVQGFSNRTWGALSLPFPLRNFGGGECKIGVSHDTLFVRQLGRSGTATSRITIPRLRGIAGAKLYYQWLVVDPRANRFGLVTSDVGVGRIGR